MLPEFLSSSFHFAAPLWLWGYFLLPLVWLAYGLFYRRNRIDGGDIERFADAHLLPHLIAQGGEEHKKQGPPWRPLLIWSVLWILGLTAMAGPRWDYTDVETFRPADSLVVLLDLSRSMDVSDVKPSRLARARQEIEDIMRAGHGIKIGLVAFARVPHMITPLTEDTQTVSRLLPSLETGLVFTQGSALAPALEMAGDMLKNEPGKQKHILILSDGGFADKAQVIERGSQLRDQGVKIHTLGLGTAEGGPVPGAHGAYLRDNGRTVISYLDEELLREIARTGNGRYLQAGYLDQDTQSLLQAVQTPQASGQEKAGQTTRFWEERFYLFLLPLLLLILPWFRRNAAFPVFVLILVGAQASPAQAADWREMFFNKPQLGKHAIEHDAYDKAAQTFSDPYRKGVAQYKAGDYEAAAQSFAKTTRPEVAERARYNMGNAQLMNGQLDQAIKTYEALLKDNPDHADARHNLAIAKKIKEQRSQQQSSDSGQQTQNQKPEGQPGGQEPQDKAGNQSQPDDQSDETGDGKPKEQNGKKKQPKDNSKDQQDQSDGQSEDGQDKDQKKPESQGKQNEPSDSPETEMQEKPNPPTEGQEKPRESKEPLPEQTPPADRLNNEPNDKGEESAEPLPSRRSQKDIDADQWLNRIETRPGEFLKNKFYIESRRAGAQTGDRPW